MPDHTRHPTPHPAVNAVLHRLLTDVQAILGDRFVGMYLYGSLASGDFNPHTSDIDFVVVTDGDLPRDTVNALEAMHERLWHSGLKWAAKLEGSYMPQDTLRRYDPEAAPCPQINEGRFYIAGQGSDWIIQRHILREQGVILAGPALRDMIDPVPRQSLRHAVIESLREWWAPMLDDPARIRSSEYQAFAVLTMCRAWYLLEEGDIVSKPVAARWMRARSDPQRADLIESALAWRHGDPLDRLGEVLDFIRDTVDRAEHTARSTGNAEDS